eukprot:9985435-Heterocapsa_arctica.AAC.1
MKRTLASSTQEEIYSLDGKCVERARRTLSSRTQAAQRLDKSHCDGKRAKRTRSSWTQAAQGLDKSYMRRPARDR